MKVLFVEDDLQTAQLFSSILRTEGYEVVHSARALEGLKHAREQTFDAIILDINLPDLDGATVGLSLRRTLPDVPIIALTANADYGTRTKTRVFGFNAFITKPCTDEDLLSTLRRLIYAEDRDSIKKLEEL